MVILEDHPNPDLVVQIRFSDFHVPVPDFRIKIKIYTEFSPASCVFEAASTPVPH
jgi:hypothetical protein